MTEDQMVEFVKLRLDGKGCDNCDRSRVHISPLNSKLRCNFTLQLVTRTYVCRDWRGGER